MEAAYASRRAFYGARHGDPLGSVPVPSSADDLSMAGRRIVFRTGRGIWLLDTRTKRTSRLATAAALPVGLSIEGRRVAWAENLRSRARIRAVFLPR